MERIRKFFHDESGATAVEYALIVALLAAIIVGLVTTLGGSLTTAFDGVGTILENPEGAIAPEEG